MGAKGANGFWTLWYEVSGKCALWIVSLRQFDAVERLVLTAPVQFSTEGPH